MKINANELIKQCDELIDMFRGIKPHDSIFEIFAIAEKFQNLLIPIIPLGLPIPYEAYDAFSTVLLYAHMDLHDSYAKAVWFVSDYLRYKMELDEKIKEIISNPTNEIKSTYIEAIEESKFYVSPSRIKDLGEIQEKVIDPIWNLKFQLKYPSLSLLKTDGQPLGWEDVPVEVHANLFDFLPKKTNFSRVDKQHYQFYSNKIVPRQAIVVAPDEEKCQHNKNLFDDKCSVM